MAVKGLYRFQYGHCLDVCSDGHAIITGPLLCAGHSLSPAAHDPRLGHIDLWSA